MAVILATNVPSVLDAAVLDRMDEAFEFPRRELCRGGGIGWWLEERPGPTTTKRVDSF